MRIRQPYNFLCVFFLLVACGSGDGSDNDDNESDLGKNCGGIQGTTCSESFYCEFPTNSTNSCGAKNTQGTCKRRPEICTQEFNPVCGCDGKTYGNACEAAGAGQSLRPITDCTQDVR